jgi:hypothetical protein
MAAGSHLGASDGFNMAGRTCVPLSHWRPALKQPGTSAQTLLNDAIHHPTVFLDGRDA